MTAAEQSWTYGVTQLIYSCKMGIFICNQSVTIGIESGCQTGAKPVVVSKVMGFTSVIDHLSALPFACDLQTEHKCIFLAGSLFPCTIIS